MKIEIKDAKFKRGDTVQVKNQLSSAYNHIGTVKEGVCRVEVTDLGSLRATWLYTVKYDRGETTCVEHLLEASQ